MKLTRVLKIMSVITVLSLVYIHMQMQIIDLAYKEKSKEDRIKMLIEENGNVMYTILTLKSANYLGIKMLDEDFGMQFVETKDIVQISASEKFFNDLSPDKQLNSGDKKKSLLTFLSLSSQAEAMTRE